MLEMHGNGLRVRVSPQTALLLKAVCDLAALPRCRAQLEFDVCAAFQATNAPD